MINQKFLFFLLLSNLNNICQGSETNIKDFAHGLDLKIFSFLNPSDLFCMGLTSKGFDTKVTDYLQSGYEKIERRDNFSNYLLLQSRGDLDFNPLISIDNYLAQQERAPISKILGLQKLFREDPIKFLRLLLKSAPHTPASIVPNLEVYYKQTLQVEKLVASLPFYENPQQKLANIILDLIIWHHVKTQVWAQVDRQVNLQVTTEIIDQVKNQIEDQFRIHVASKILDKILDQTGNQVGTQVWEKVRNQVVYQVATQVGNQLDENLGNFQFEQADQDGNLDPVVKMAVDYSFTIYQIGIIAMNNSEEFKNILAEVVKSLSHKTGDEIKNILNSIERPKTQKYFLFETQLEMIRRHLLY